ncbi:hypothetical protein L228DRAFT_57673 [Xylona heveae TC161]|uniref:Succinate dehydrogenase assembly factor 4, mitochondrial n=1 Tax=Xylona heveae (strain CBS 132557 / TC161) TaxID=1328760 RepID=A0A165IGT0_XYLHT|nr:hypothetical protein L228DRAFT_57673 [Xylona heveae TC161]KZF24873.1 hypothetical protein L228DRAFT_57673 [Xylona heveae TC161]
MSFRASYIVSRPLKQICSRRLFSRTSTVFQHDEKPTPWSTGPSPPRLPKEEQEIFERLQRASTGAFSTPSVHPSVIVNQSPATNQSTSESLDAAIAARGDGEELHPDVRRGAKPEFEGDVNPRTGEVGGPKNEPLRWGGDADWSYNGRVTDF